MNTWATHLTAFYKSLQPEEKLPKGIDWLLPHHQPAVQQLQQRFFYKFYNDRHPRTLLLGINPGRFGAGVTGINFTASRQLTEHCAIGHDLKQQTELSADFIYEVIQAYGGAAPFYSRFFIGSVCPLGFVKGGKNMNYYDDGDLQKAVSSFILSNLRKLLSYTVDHTRCICIGGAKNFHYLSRLNEQHNLFNEIVPLPHPRFIMQYRRKQKHEYVDLYLRALEK